MNNPYITFELFDCMMMLDFKYMSDYDCLTDAEKRGLYLDTATVIDSQYKYIGVQLNWEHAFPRSFEDEITLIQQQGTFCSYTTGTNEGQIRIDFLRKYNRIIPAELKTTCFYLGRDLLSFREFEGARQLQGAVGSKIAGNPIYEVAPTRNWNKYSRETTQFIDQFIETYNAFKYQ